MLSLQWRGPRECWLLLEGAPPRLVLVYRLLLGTTAAEVRERGALPTKEMDSAPWVDGDAAPPCKCSELSRHALRQNESPDWLAFIA